MGLKEVCKIDKNNKKKGIEIEVLNSEGILINTFCSIMEASRNLKINYMYIREICKGKRVAPDGLIIRYKHPINDRDARRR